MVEAVVEKRAKRRRWLQFSLRSLLVGVLAVSLGMSWVAARMQRVKRQQEAVQVLDRFPCVVWWDFERSARVPGPQPDGPPGPAWARNLFGEYFFTDVEFVCLQTEDDFTDAQMAHIGELRKLRILRLGADGVTDAGLAHVGRLRELEELSLYAPRVTDAGLVHLRRLSRLRELCLDESQVGDAGLAYLRGLRELETLTLWAPRVTDAGLVHLEGLSRLRELDLLETQVTPDGVRKLREALPGCKIEY